VPQTGQQFQNAVRNTTGYLTDSFGPANAQGAAHATLYRELLRQASNWAFVDVFRWLSLLSFGCVAAVWLLKKVKPGKGPVGAH
jgi:DHA2 family multidrug resistance protein